MPTNSAAPKSAPTPTSPRALSSSKRFSTRCGGWFKIGAFSAANPIRVYLVDDSPLALVLLRRMLSNSPEIEVVGTARSGLEALAALEAARPDVICTDYKMPGMDGLELIRHIMARFPRPILVVSSLIDPANRDQVFPLLAAGAVDVIAKPEADQATAHTALLVQKIKLLSGVVVIARRMSDGQSTAAGAQINPAAALSVPHSPREAPHFASREAPHAPPFSQLSTHDKPAPMIPAQAARELASDMSFDVSLGREASPAREPGIAIAPVVSHAPQTFEAARLALQSALDKQPAPRAALRAAIALAGGANADEAPPILRAYQVHPIRIVAIGASTGGPQILHAIFARLPLLPCPILCVQHISAGFLQGLVDWLHDAGRARVKIAEHHEIAAPGTIYFPPEGAHLEIDAKGRLTHLPTPPVGGHRPAITVTFESVARAFGNHSLGVLLTGMGCDGAAGLETLMLAGSATIAQDEASSVVFGMPKQAIARGAAHFVLPGEQIAEKIARLVLAG